MYVHTQYYLLPPPPLQVIIEHGDLICGILSKETLGNKGGSLMHVVVLELGHEVARQFYGNIQKVSNIEKCTNSVSIIMAANAT